MATIQEIKEVFSTYFTPDYTGQLDEDLIQKILKLYEEEKISSNKIGERLLKENKLNINPGVIGRILTKARTNNIVKKIPRTDLTGTLEQVVQGKNRKIHNVVREITSLDRKQIKDIPKNAKYKIVFATPGAKNTKIPEEFIGVKYFDTKQAADTALNKRLTSNFQPVGDPAKSSVKRAQTRAANVKAVTKGASAADKASVNIIEQNIKKINKYFQKNPELINETPFGKNIKAMMSLRLDKNSGNLTSRLKPDSYYLAKAKEGQLFDLFDVNPVAGKKPGGRFVTNLNISPNQFNRAFIGSQLTNYFKRDKINPETKLQLDNALKKLNMKVDLPTVGKVGATAADVAYDSKTGSFPRILKTLDVMEAPNEIKELFTNTKTKELKAIPGIISADQVPIPEKTKVLNMFKNAYKDAGDGSEFRKVLDTEFKCADGCFIKVANKNPERVAKKLSEDPKLIRLFRGESFPQRNVKAMKSSAEHFGTTLAEMKKDKLSGQWYTPNQAHAKAYLSRPGQMKYVDVTPAELESFNRYKAKVNKRPMKYSMKKKLGLPNPPGHGVTPSEFHQIIPRYKLKQMEEAGRLKNKWDLNPLGERYMSDVLVKPAKGVLEYDDLLGGFVDSANPGEIVGQNQLKAWAQDNPMPVKVGEAAPGILRKTGKALAHLGLPLPTAAMDAYFIGREIEEGKSPEEIARNPLNWLGLATMDPLTKAAGMAEKSGKLASVMRLGMSPGLIRGATRFLGLPGLALSTGLTAYDQYQKYKNKEGFIYDLFNREEIDNAQV